MILIGLAILFFGAAIWLLIQYIKSFKGVKIEGIIIDNVEGYTEEYFKYLPEYKEKHDKFQSQLESLGNTLNTNIAEDTKTHDRVFIVEYIVNGEKYYFEVPIDSISAHYKIGDTYKHLSEIAGHILVIGILLLWNVIKVKG